MDHLIFATSGRSVLTEVANSLQNYLPETEAAQMPEQMHLAFLMAQAADLSHTWPQLAQWIVSDRVYGVSQYVPEHEAVNHQITNLFQRFTRGENISESQWLSPAKQAQRASWERVAIADYTAYEAMMCASYCAETMSQLRREENYLFFGEDGMGHASCVSTMHATALAAKGQAWATQTMIALRDKLFELMWQAV